MSNQLQLVFKEDIEKLVPQAILFNYDELKDGIAFQLKHYQNRIYEEGQIDDAKKDRALLNKLAKSLNDIRISSEREYNKPFVEFKNNVNELIGMIKETSDEIDASIKSYEAEKDAEKKEVIKEYFDVAIKRYADFVQFDAVFNEKWLNKTYKYEAIKADIDQLVVNIDNALTAIRALNSDDEKYLISFYFRSLDLAAALTENARLQEERKRVEALAQNKESAPISPLSNEKQYTIRFEVEGTAAQMKALKAFLIENEILYRAIK